MPFCLRVYINSAQARELTQRHEDFFAIANECSMWNIFLFVSFDNNLYICLFKHVKLNKKVAFILNVHRPNDERVWYQQAACLKEAGHEVFVFSGCVSLSDLPNVFCFDGNGISVKERVRKIAEVLKTWQPDVLVCDSSVAILGAKKYKKIAGGRVRIIYDITEWYPSKKNLRNSSFVGKIAKACVLIAFSFYTALCLDGFIFGEHYKSKPFRLFFPWKKYIYLSYYATLDFIKEYPLNDISKECRLFYSGNMTMEKGFLNVVDTAILCAARFPSTTFILQIISRTEGCIFPDELPKNLKIEKRGFLPFLEFCREIGKADIFLDLRQTDMENTRCLPIKLFYYMATGRPVIYSDLKAIRKEAPEVTEAGCLVNPEDTEAIVAQISSYLKDAQLYSNHCMRARELVVQKYNWGVIKTGFEKFISNPD